VRMALAMPAVRAEYHRLMKEKAEKKANKI
jgi:hypothetical protein